MQSHYEYGILEQEEPEGGPYNTGARVRGDVHGATRGMDNQERTETATGDKTGQCALLARGMPEDGDEERIPPKRPCD